MKKLLCISLMAMSLSCYASWPEYDRNSDYGTSSIVDAMENPYFNDFNDLNEDLRKMPNEYDVEFDSKYNKEIDNNKDWVQNLKTGNYEFVEVSAPQATSSIGAPEKSQATPITQEVVPHHVVESDHQVLQPVSREQIKQEILEGLRNKAGIPYKKPKPIPSKTEEVIAVPKTEEVIAVQKEIMSVINNSFASIDSWLEKGLTQSTVPDIPDFNKKTICLTKLHAALQSLGKSIESNKGMEQINDLVARSLDFFDTPTQIGRGQGSIENKIIAGTINAIKKTLYVSLATCVQVSSFSLGVAGGAVAGAGVGLASGLHRAATGTINEKSVVNKLVFKDVDTFLLKNAPKLFVNSIVKTLYHVVQTPVLIAYGASEGIALGALLGVEAHTQVGKKIINVKVDIDSKKAVRAQDETNVSKSENKKPSLVDQIQEVMKDPFASADNWAVRVETSVKVDKTLQVINQALDAMGKKLGVTPKAMQPIKDATAQTAQNLADTSGQLSSTNVQVIIRSVKYILVTPIQAAIRAGAIAIGSSAGVVGGTVVGVGATIHKTKRKVKTFVQDSSGQAAIRAGAIAIGSSAGVAGGTVVGVEATIGKTKRKVKTFVQDSSGHGSNKQESNLKQVALFLPRVAAIIAVEGLRGVRDTVILAGQGGIVGAKTADQIIIERITGGKNVVASIDLAVKDINQSIKKSLIKSSVKPTEPVLIIGDASSGKPVNKSLKSQTEIEMVPLTSKSLEQARETNIQDKKLQEIAPREMAAREMAARKIQTQFKKSQQAKLAQEQKRVQEQVKVK